TSSPVLALPRWQTALAVSKRKKEERVEVDLGGLRRRVDADLLALTPSFKLHHSGNPREESMIAAKAHVETGMERGASLSHDDTAGVNDFSPERLDSQVLRIAIATVPR